MFILSFATLSIMLCFISVKILPSRVNPITLYVVPWLFSVGLYEARLIYYYDLSLITCVLVIFAEILFCVCCFITIIWHRQKDLKRVVNTYCNNVILEKELKKWIMILSTIAGIAIFSAGIKVLSAFDYNVIRVLNSAVIIYNTVRSEGGYITIPYVTSFAPAALVFSGIYCKKFGFKCFMFFPIILVALIVVVSGSRYILILSAIQFIVAIISTTNDRIQGSNIITILKKNKLFVAAISIVVYVFYIATKSRSVSIKLTSFVSPTMVNLVEIFGLSIYKNYVYFSTSVGILSAYLDESYYLFGRATFAFMYRILSKLEIAEPLSIARDYYVPVNVNTGTYLKEFIADFHLLAPFAIIIWAYICGSLYIKAKERQQIRYLALYSSVAAILSFCFFSWYMSETIFWIEFFVVWFVGKRIDKNVFGKTNMEANLDVTD